MSRLKVKALVEGYDQFIGIDAHKKTCHVPSRTLKDRLASGEG